ncbi:hypothetical protein FCG67_18965 [Rhodococcus oryzae]|uniref:Uncharacterized protein n=1 Tax=Rhodococcus oryzae TaxID=2571143 RepID=A0ABY2RGM9_9NOCA|nr:hypothetical protein [Rhodococcus oryzae]TJZ76089.1 hypothetical protein FCG67_18965 [Rhodococcus oryzae]
MVDTILPRHAFDKHVFCYMLGATKPDLTHFDPERGDDELGVHSVHELEAMCAALLTAALDAECIR